MKGLIAVLPAVALVGQSACGANAPDKPQRETAKATFVEGTNAAFVELLIRAVDQGDNRLLREELEGVKFTSLLQDEARAATPTDLPGSVEETCKIDTIIGGGDRVIAHWQCGAYGASLDRAFLFRDGRFVDLIDPTEMYGE